MERKPRPPPPKRNVIRIKVTSMGEGGVGKSCLIKRFCEQKFVAKYSSTIGVDYGVRGVNIGGYTVRVNFWDLAGPNEFFEVRNEFYKDTQGAFLVFDVTSRKSFEAMDSWVKEAFKFGAKNAIIFVCANKIDAEKRVVTEREGMQWAQSRGFGYCETSAQSGENVDDMFMTLFKKVVSSITNTPID